MISDILKYSFLQNAFLVAILASIASGITGSYVVKKKMTFVSGGLAHAVLGGIGIAYFFDVNTSIGAIIFALLFSGILTLAKINTKQNEDTLIGVLWAIGMAVGIIFIHLKPGYNVDMMSFIFGNILMIEKQDIRNILVMDLGIIISVLVFYKHFLYVSFDEFFLKVKGSNVSLFYFLLLTLISITIVILIKVVGLILVISLLTIPTITISKFVKTFQGLIFGSIILGMVFNITGLSLSYYLNFPASATIILVSGCCYIISLLLKKSIS